MLKNELLLDSVKRYGPIIKIPVFLPYELARPLAKGLNEIRFSNVKYPVGEAHESSSLKIAAMLNFYLQQEQLFRWIERNLNTGALNYVDGRLIRYVAGQSTHRLDWHDDLSLNMKCGLTICLSPGPRKGGTFQIHDEVKKMKHQSTLSRFGSAHLFPIRRSLKHRLTPVKSGTDRIVYSAWFGSR